MWCYQVFANNVVDIENQTINMIYTLFHSIRERHVSKIHLITSKSNLRPLPALVDPNEIIKLQRADEAISSHDFYENNHKNHCADLFLAI